jgi:hypothetical protein
MYSKWPDPVDATVRVQLAEEVEQLVVNGAWMKVKVGLDAEVTFCPR